jgi:hypothetical protein
MSTIINGTSSAITFPDSSVQNTSAIVSGYVPYANLPAGSVLQVINVLYPTNVSTASTSVVATGLSASITPKFTTSKILVLANMNGVGENSGTNGVHFEIFRNSTSLTYWDDIAGYGSANANYSSAITYMDSPASTSSLAYSVYYSRVGGGGGIAYINNYTSGANRTCCSLTLLEIAA